MKDYKDGLVRYEITLYGIVQGVGFRPYIYNKALELGIKGCVRNMGSSVVIDAEASRSSVKSFIKLIVHSPPPLAQIEGVSIRIKELRHLNSFAIVKSDKADEAISFIPKDTAICEKCKQDIFDEGSRWYGYAFTNCTDCGPRYSIIKELPYDRCNTSMGSFEMCFNCSADYNEPSSRRFHAQPVCCTKCGPELQLLDKSGQQVQSADVIKNTVQLLKEGMIIAVKGIGGFHLMCDCSNEQAIAALRNRKRRPHKPLAIMVKDLDTIRRWCLMDDVESELLQSSAKPIVLLDKKNNSNLSALIAPDTHRIGVMLPYTPLHYLLFKEGLECLIATSGNISGSPIEYENGEALIKLRNVADFFLVNNRDINVPVDDSVAKVFRGNKLVSRLGRGYTPLNLNLGIKHQLIALGAEQKAAVCLSKNGYAYMSQYLGDLKNPMAYHTYKKVLANLQRLVKVSPVAYVHDLHPGYNSTKYALEQQQTNIAVQHHFAHMSACMAENKLNKPAIGVVYDGTGLGDDGKIWGGEFFIGDLKGCRRAGQLRYMSIQGGDKAIAEPWRVAVSYLHQIGLEERDLFRGIEGPSIEMLKAALDSGFNCIETSSMGRLFDCIAALLGLCHSITYDSQGAIRLENISDADVYEIYDYCIHTMGDYLEIDFRQLLIEVILDIERGKEKRVIAGKFHKTIADFTVVAVKMISKYSGIKDVVLSGGCFENSLLLRFIIDGLESNGFRAHVHKLVPCNDGGISLGQLAAADFILRG